MKSYRRLHEHSWLFLIVLTAITVFTAGCSSSSSSSGGNVNPLGAYQGTGNSTGLITDGTVQNPGQISSPIVSVPTQPGGIDGHDNAPLLDNMHPGWQQASCLSCHNDTTRNPDHNYTDDKLCYLCHGTNGLPGFGDNIPPVISGVVTAPLANSVTINWKSDEECISRLVLKTLGGDRLEFPVSTTYKTSHKYEINGLVEKTTYNFELICTDKSGNRTTTQTFGVLSFTTLDKTPALSGDDGSGEVPPDTNPVQFFSSIKIEESGAFKSKVSFGVLKPARCIIYFVDKETNTLADDVDVGVVNSSYSGIIGSFQPSKTYSAWIEAVVSDTGEEYQTGKYDFTTEAF